jgi:hypothetical protein
VGDVGDSQNTEDKAQPRSNNKQDHCPAQTHEKMTPQSGKTETLTCFHILNFLITAVWDLYD